MSDAQDVVAKALYKYHFNGDDFAASEGYADTAISALHAAGYHIAPPGSVVVSGEGLTPIKLYISRCAILRIEPTLMGLQSAIAEAEGVKNG